MLMIKKLRIEAGLSQGKLANKFHTTQGAICQVENGKRRAWRKLRRQLNRFFGLPIEQLFSEVEEVGANVE